MTAAVDLIAALTVLALGVVTVMGTVRALAPRRPVALPDPFVLDVGWAMRALQTQIEHHPTHRRGEIVVSGVPVTVTHVLRLDGEGAWPAWVVTVGEHGGETPTLDAALELVRGRLQAIADARAERAGGAT